MSSNNANNSADVRKSLFLDINAGLFKAYQGEPITFFFVLKNTEQNKFYEDLVVAYGGQFEESEVNINSRTVIISQRSPFTPSTRPVFKVDYIIDCITRNCLLDISKYVHGTYTNKPNDFYMKVIFYLEDEFPPMSNVRQSFIEPIRQSITAISEVRDLTDCSDSWSSCISNSSRNTRSPYTIEEKEAIMKFLIDQGKYTGLKGNGIWKKMERRGICPNRTYQSLKNHFLKTVIFELDRFSFLTEAQKSAYRKQFSIQ